MKETNYKKLYTALYLKQVAFTSYIKDGNYIVEYNDDIITVSDDKCYLNGNDCLIDSIISMI